MVIASFDIETYKLYDGTKESKDHIIMHSLNDEAVKKFKRTKEIGYHYPVLNAQDFFIGGIKREDRKKPVFFNKAKSMMDYMDALVKKEAKQGHQIYFYGHNAKFDMAGLLKDRMDDLDDFEIIRPHPIIALLGKKKQIKRCKECDEEQHVEKTVCKNCNSRRLRTIDLKKRGYILDTMGFEKTSLEKIGERLNFPKGKLPEKVKQKQELKKYLERDLDITLKVVTDIRDKLSDLSHKPRKLITSGQLAMNFFKRYMSKRVYCKACGHKWKGEIKKCDIHKYIKQKGQKCMDCCSELVCTECGELGNLYSAYLFRQGTIHQSNHVNFLKRAYRSGRVECFQQGVHEGVTMIDKNAMYPWILAEDFIMPDLVTEEHYVGDGSEGVEYFLPREEILGREGVIKATIVFPKKKNVPYLATKGVRGVGLFFPINTTCTGYWSTFEVRNAIKEGYVLEKIHEAVIYRKNLVFNPFTEIMKELYTLRSTDLGNVAKLLMNSLGGKFSQVNKTKIYKEVPRDEFPRYEGEGWEFEYSNDEKYRISKVTDIRIPPHSHPIISLLMTARARDDIYRQYLKIPFKDLLYSDTDSIAFKGNHLNKFDISKEFGKWKIECRDGTGAFVKERVYRTTDGLTGKEKTVIAGNTKKNITERQLWGKDPIKQKKMYTIKWALSNKKIKEKVGQFYEEQRTLNVNMTKRKVTFPPKFEEFMPMEMKSVENQK